MLTKPTLSEKIIRGLSTLEEAFYLPKSDSQLAHWFEQNYYRKQKRKKAHERRMRKRISEALRRLEKEAILSRTKEDKSYRLTPKGWLRYLYYHASEGPQDNPSPLTQSKMNYLIIFDIPEAHRRFRDLLRQGLKNQGSKMLQKSVFLCSGRNSFEWAKRVVKSCELDGHVLFIEASKLN